MKVLQILPELNMGGVETGTVDLAKYLIAHGHKAVIVSHGGVLVGDCEKAGAVHYKLPVHKKNLWTAFKCIQSLEKIITDENVDIVHARSRVPAWIAFFATRRTKTPFITTCHGYYRSHIFSRVMGWAKLVIVPSRVIGKRMIDDFKVPSKDIRLIPRSVDLDKFRDLDVEKLKSEYVISIVGRITPLKGHIYFLKAMAKVVRNIPNVKIWIVGDVPAQKEAYREELQLLVKRLGLSDYVEFLGQRRDIPLILAKTNCLVLSTVTQEAFGRVILEAQAAGVPVVATRVGGVIDIVDEGKTGLLVPPKDVDAMAQSVIRLLRDKNLAKEISIAARQKLQEKFTLTQMAEKTLSVYKEIMGMTSILVIKLSSIGDVVLVIPSLKALREKFPLAKIFCLTGKNSRSIIQRCPYLNGIVVYDPEHKDRGVIGLFKLARKLRRAKFDKIIDFQNNRKSHLLSFLSFPQESYGFDNGKLGFLLTHRKRDDERVMSPVEHQFEVLSMLDIQIKKDVRLEVWLTHRDEDYARSLLESEWLGSQQDIIGINIAASARWSSKNWPVRYIAELCDLCGKRGWRVILTGIDKDREAAQEVLSLAKTRPAIFIGKTDMLQLAALIKHCRVFVTPDSAPMHVAAAVGTPFVALFGPTDPRRHLPPAKHFSLLRKELICSNCYAARCRVISHACMVDISPQEVFSEVEKLKKFKK